MEYSDVEATIACLPRGRTLFRYYPDRYAAYLLSRMVGESVPIATVRKSHYGRLLERPRIRQVAARAGDGVLRASALGEMWPQDSETYLLTLGIWGAQHRRLWSHPLHQTSRAGANLVLQLNFSARHDEFYGRLMGERRERPFVFENHPNAPSPFHTLAWARIDLEYDTGEALIEEVQSDWVKLAHFLAAHIDILSQDREAQNAAGLVAFRGAEIDVAAFRAYLDNVLRVHMKMWDEAMLTAALWFLAEEIAIRRVYYHDYDCGQRLKAIEGGVPPRSLYTRLPTRFCFTRTDAVPSFLLQRPTAAIKTLRHTGQLKFWRLDL